MNKWYRVAYGIDLFIAVGVAVGGAVFAYQGLFVEALLSIIATRLYTPTWTP